MCSPAVSPLKLESFSPNSRGQREGETQPTFFPHQHPIRTKPTLINSVFFPERAFTLLPSDLGKLIFAPLHHHHCQLPRNSQGTALQHVAQEGLDIVSYLPVEISVAILLYLTPQDLCSASAVCSRWYQLTQHSDLYKIRKDYVQKKREEYKESRENYPPHRSPTPSQTFARPRNTSPSFSPLSSIQPTSPPHQHSYSQPTSPTGLESSRSSTPSPTLLVDRVSRLSLNDQDLSIRQCLFSKLPPYSPSTPEGDGGKCLKAGLYSSRLMPLKEGRKLSAKKKNRLRRL